MYLNFVLTILFSIFISVSTISESTSKQIFENQNNLQIEMSSSDDCEGSCLSASVHEYCVAFSEMRWGQRNRTIEEAEACNSCTGTDLCTD